MASRSSSPTRNRAAPRLLHPLAPLVACLVAGACERGGNFSQHSGFDAYFAANPPATEPPPAADRELLWRHRPRIFLAAGAAPPIRFYEDYIAHGRLLAADGRLVSGRVTPEALNARRTDPGVVFEHRDDGSPTAPVLYGRVDRERFVLAGRERRFTFLTWHAVFRVSGIGAGVGRLQGLLLGVAGDLDDWHQLDHYTAVTLALDEGRKPVAVMLQQHNYRRTYVLGADLPPPADGRVAVDVALRSNELYPHRPGRTVRRAVGFISEGNVPYLVHGTGRPFRVADDITDPAREIAYGLEFLPPSDAFYTFQGYLGERRLLPGRDGPPGADYNTLPRLKPLHVQMVTFHWRDGDPDYVEWFRSGAAGIARLARRFARLIERRAESG